MVRKPWQAFPPWGPMFAPLGSLYALVQSWRRRRYAANPGLAHRFPCPVISVGNLVVGGTGKTPFVDLLLDLLPPDLRPALVLARGYGARVGEGPDALDEEGGFLAHRHPEALIAQGRDRVAAARGLVERAGVVILDDGAQHLRVARDLEIILFDAGDLVRPRYALPAGPWRENIEAARGAALLVLSRCDEVSARDLERARAILAGLFPEKALVEARHRPWALEDGNGKEVELAELAGRDLVAVSGIARPESFVRGLVGCGARVVDRLDFADHQAYGPPELARIGRGLDRRPGALLVTTAKDADKLRPLLDQERRARLRVLQVRLELTRGREELERQLVALVEAGPRRG